MATPSEISRLRDYFTLTDNGIICDFCFNSYDIIINNEEIRKHLKTHKGHVNAALYTEGDLKKFYIVHNNTIKCKLCKHLYIPWNTHSIIKYHLEDGHETNEDKVKKTYKWIREKYTLNESDATKQYCNQCKEGIQNKLVHLFSHLDSAHKDRDCSEHRPINEIMRNRLDNDIFDNWIWNYFIRDGENALCSICNNKCDYKLLTKINTEVTKHLRNEHTSPRLIKESRQLTKQNYTEIQDGRVKCNICNKVFEQPIYINFNVRNHLKDVHDITCEQSEVLRKWVFKHIDKLVGFQNSQCKHCNKGNKLQKMCVFDIFKHLIKDHRIETPPEISSMRVCKEFIDSLSTDENVKNIPTSNDPQPGSSKSSDIEVRDVKYDRDSRMENLKRNGEYAQCSICHKDYKFLSRATGKIKTHMLKEHNISDVSLESNLSQKYFEIETVVCNICNTRIELTSCIHFHLQSHLKTKHEITSVQSEVFCEWVFNHIDKLRGFQNSNCKHCDKGYKKLCKEFIDSLSSDENVKNIPTSSDPQPGSSKSSDIEVRDVNYDRDSRMENLKRVENILDSIFDNWIWNYFIRNGEYAQCSICHKDYKFLSRSTGNIKTHMLMEHNISDTSLESNLSQKYFEIETVICNFCNTRIELTSCIHSHLQRHLKTKHEITSVQSEVFCEWVFKHIDKLRGFQNSNCKHCDKGLQKMCVFDIFRHLVKNDGIKTPPEISSMKVCKEFIDSLSSDENVKNIPTSSDPQPGSSKSSDIEFRDVNYDRDSRMENLKRKSSSLLSSDKNVKYTATSSMDSQPGCSKFPDDHNSGMKRMKYDDDKRLPDELRDILIDPVEFAKNPENLDVSQIFPEVEEVSVDPDDWLERFG